MKKKLFVLAIAVMILAMLATGTLAYYSSRAVVHNVITSGGVDITVEEYQKVDEELVPYPTDPVPVMPGNEVSKIVTIRNEKAASYIRVRVNVTITDGDGKTMKLSEEELKKILTLDYDTENWLRKSGDEEWWYYKNAVETKASTKPLFTTVTFNGEALGNDYQRSTFKVSVDAQAVQVDNNGTDVLTAAGWPQGKKGE